MSNSGPIIHALSFSAPVALASTWLNASAGCAVPTLPAPSAEAAGDRGPERRLLTRRDCSRFYCVPDKLDKDFRRISPAAHRRELTLCAGFISESDEQRCGHGQSCYLDAGVFYRLHVEQGRVARGGFMKDAGDVAGSLLTLLLALALFAAGLLALSEFSAGLVVGASVAVSSYVSRMYDPLAVVAGFLLTLVTQSSSVTTSALAPLCGLGLLPLAKVFPLTLGANLGTTLAALPAALATASREAVEIALCHVFFNLAGALIWLPVPALRRIPLRAAALLGLYASHVRATPAVYVLVVFVAAPATLMGVALLWEAAPSPGQRWLWRSSSPWASSSSGGSASAATWRCPRRPGSGGGAPSTVPRCSARAKLGVHRGALRLRRRPPGGQRERERPVASLFSQRGGVARG